MLWSWKIQNWLKIGWVIHDKRFTYFEQTKKKFFGNCQKRPMKIFEIFFSTQNIILWPLEGILMVGTKSEGVVSSWYISGILTLIHSDENLTSLPSLNLTLVWIERIPRIFSLEKTCIMHIIYYSTYLRMNMYFSNMFRN